VIELLAPAEGAIATQTRPRVTLAIGGDHVSFDWGEPHELGSAAFWVSQAAAPSADPGGSSFRLGASLAEEIVACLLGGYGVPASVGLAAFERLRACVDLSAAPTPDVIERILCRPLTVPGSPRPRRYRFPRQRAARIAAALERVAATRPPQEPVALRAWLIDLPGIGPKTASWIVRNHTGSNEVAIIDIHIHRAGVAAGFFPDHWRLPRDYDRFEASFLEVANIGGVAASRLDAVMWFTLQQLGRHARVVYGQRGTETEPDFG
jgi:N-glycosylase/DNA lyase